MTTEELLKRYAAGERDFRGVFWPGADLQEARLREADLRDADMQAVNLNGGEKKADYGRR